MPNNAGKRARKTYTRRTVKQKFEDAIDELKTLITRHCGNTEGIVARAAESAANQAVARLTPMLATNAGIANLAPMAPMAEPAPLSLVAPAEVAPSKAAALKALAAKKGLMPQMPLAPATIAKPKKMTCPGGPALYNKFIIQVTKNLKDMEIDLPYQEVKGIASEYWKKIKTDVCFNDESGELLQEFANKAAVSIATGASNTANYNNLVARTKALQVPKGNGNSNSNGATRKLVKTQKVVQGANAAANFAKKAGLPNMNFSTIKTAAAPTRKVRVQVAANKPAVTPGRTITPLGGVKTPAAAATAAAGAAYDPFANLFGSAPATAAPSLGAGSYNNMNLLGLGPAVQEPARPQTLAPSAPLSIGQSMPTAALASPSTNNSVREITINGNPYFMNVATKGLYEKDEATNSFGPWVGYRQNNGSIRYTDAPENM